MGFVRSYKKILKDGSVREYYARVESYREGEKVRQRVIEHLGRSPHQRNIALDPPTARRVAPILAEPGSPTELMERLQDIGIDIGFRPRQLMLLNTPPLRRLALRVE